MSYKFILDTNILQEEPVDKLIKARLGEACDSGRFSFYVTPVLLKETLEFVSKGKIPQGAEKPTKFLTELKWQRFFNEWGGPEGIFLSELRGKAQSEYIFHERAIVNNIKSILVPIVRGGQLTEEDQCYLRDDYNLEGKNKEEIVGELRARREEAKGDIRLKELFKGEVKISFKDFLVTTFEKEALKRIKELSDKFSESKERLMEYWVKNRDKCKYFNKYVEAVLYNLWFVFVPKNDPKIDKNYQEDLSHLLYLNGVDGIVSNEQRYMKAACRELFPEKDYLSLDEFIDKLSKSRKPNP